MRLFMEDIMIYSLERILVDAGALKWGLTHGDAFVKGEQVAVGAAIRFCELGRQNQAEAKVVVAILRRVVVPVGARQFRGLLK